jgi:N-acetyl-gamma-glutamyl-phosphate reductase
LPGRPSIAEVHAVLEEAYHGQKLVEVESLERSAQLKILNAELLKHTNRMKLFVCGSVQARQARLIAVLDNLGKGAGGAAVQNLNLMLGREETCGLV